MAQLQLKSLLGKANAILEKSTNRKGLPVFKINQNIITYKTKSH